MTEIEQSIYFCGQDCALFWLESRKKRKWGRWWCHILQIPHQADATDPLRALIRTLTLCNPKLQCRNIHPDLGWCKCDLAIHATNVGNHWYKTGFLWGIDNNVSVFRNLGEIILGPRWLPYKAQLICLAEMKYRLSGSAFSSFALIYVIRPPHTQL